MSESRKQFKESQDWAEVWAKDFHDTYERLATVFGYQTRIESARPWPSVPETNRKLMIATCAEVLCRFVDKFTTDQFEAGRLAGLEEAAKIVDEVESGYGSIACAKAARAIREIAQEGK